MAVTTKNLMPSPIELYHAGQLVDASQASRKILAANPNDPNALYVMGLLAQRAGNLELSLQLLRQLLQHSPDHLEALIQLGDVLTALGKFADAEATHQRFIALVPNLAIGWTNLGNVLRVQGKMDDALAAYRAAIQADSNFAPAFSNLGNLLKDFGQIEVAIDAFRRALDLEPTSAQMHSNLVYATNFCPGYDAFRILDEALAWANRHEKPLLHTHRPHDNNLDPNRKLKIGYVSPDFRNHIAGRCVLPILENHDRTQFEIHCFSVVSQADAMTPRFQHAADHWHECAGMDDAVLAEKIRAQQIDILIDLTMHMAGNRLKTFARKPAPVQATWIGYPSTTGLRSIDYRITDPYLDPPGCNDADYSEKSVRLPNSYWCYRPIEGAPEVNSSPAAEAGFVTFGCLNQFGKVSREARNLWSAVLNAVPTARLIVLGPPGQNFLADIDPARGSFVALTTPDQHLIRYHQIDIALDPLPYTGHTTTLDALWMGVPVVTLRGNTCVSRGSVTALSNLNLQHLIAFTPDEYINIAAALARNLPEVCTLRQNLRQQMLRSPLCDEQRFTQDLEIAYRLMWQTFCK